MELLVKRATLMFAAFILLLRGGVVAIPLADFYQFGSEAGDILMNRNDDGFSPPITLPPYILLEEEYNIICVYTDGYFSPICMDGIEFYGLPSIMPYYADVDTRPEDGGHVWYRLTNSSEMIQQAVTDISKAYPSLSSIIDLVIATWDHVGYYKMKTDKTNTFQAIFAVGLNQSYVIYLFADGLMQWTDNGGFSEGFSFANDTIFTYTEVEELTLASNIECPGVWVLRTDKPEPVYPKNVECNFAHTLGNPSKCSAERLPSPKAYDCTNRFGSCVPYHPITSETLCSNIYKPDEDYVYISNNRSGGRLSNLLTHLDLSIPPLLETLTNCRETARRILCHYYLPPCGKGKEFHPPTSVCPDQCRAISHLCPEEWAQVVQQHMSSGGVIEDKGLELIDCNDPGEYLHPLPFCCTDLSLNITNDEPTGVDEMGKLVTVGITIAVIAFFITIALIVFVLVARVILKIRHKKDTNPRICSSFGSISSDAVTCTLSPTETCFTMESDTDVLKMSATDTIAQNLREEDLLVPEENLTTLNIVGEGEFGVVYKAILKDWKEHAYDLVAVKTVKGMFSSGDLQHLIEESQIMARFDHPNVMKLLGVAISKNTPFIIMPFMAHGSLLSYLRKNRDALTVTHEDMTDLNRRIGSRLLSMCLQIAKGMEYLWQNKFVHRDLAARNCMIDLDNVIKVADFGLTKDIYSSNYIRQVSMHKKAGQIPMKLPVKWMALESLNDGVFSDKTDVWSFGVTCWEVFSLGKNPYPGVDPFSLIRYLERGERLDKPLNAACSMDIYGMMLRCWDKGPETRPNFSQLVTSISTTLGQIAGYFELNTPNDS